MEYTFFFILAPIAGGIILIAIGVTWKYRKEKIGSTLICYFTLVVGLLTTNILESVAESEQWTYLWGRSQHLFFLFLPVVWLIFALLLTGSEKRWQYFWTIMIIPTVILAFALTAPYHKVFYRTVGFVHYQGYSDIKPEYGFLFWTEGAFIYALMIFGLIIVIRFYLSSGKKYKNQALWVIGGIVTPLLFNILYILPLPIFIFKDYTPLAFAFSGFFFFMGIFWRRLLQIVPVARNLVLDDMDMAIVILNKRQAVVDFNPAAEELLGITEEVTGTPISRFPAIYPYFNKMQYADNRRFETEIQTPKGLINCDLSIKTIRNETKADIGTIITLSDVSIRVKLLEEKMKLVAKMEKTNQELKAAQTRLIHREKLASIGQISAGIAHELKNPVGFLQSNYRVLVKILAGIQEQYKPHIPEDIISEIKEILVDSNEGFERIMDVVNNLLSFSRKEVQDKKELYDFRTGIENTLKIASNLFGSSTRVDLHFEEVETVECYSGEINQVILNLLTNAAHAVSCCLDEPGIIDITVRQDDSWSICEISNNGPAIEDEIRSRIFDPFYTTKPAGEGTGIGLSIAWDIIVKRHEGQLLVSSDRERTVFTIKLPRIKEQ